MLSISLVFYAFQLSLVAYTISCVLMPDENSILSPYDDMLALLESKYKKAKVITYPLGRCEKCLSGQLALWCWFIFPGYKVLAFLYLQKHLIFITVTIFFTHTIKKMVDKWLD